MSGASSCCTNSSPAPAASARPVSVSATSTQPANRLRAFQSLPPCRNSTNVPDSAMPDSLSRPGGAPVTVIGVGVIGAQMLEGAQVFHRLAAAEPPGPLRLDRGAEPQLQQRVEVEVDRFEDLEIGRAHV